MIKFSVITCTYNASAVLARTLDSVLSQSWTQIEHIIIDGASKDNTLAMAQAYSLKNQEEENEQRRRKKFKRSSSVPKFVTLNSVRGMEVPVAAQQ